MALVNTALDTQKDAFYWLLTTFSPIGGNNQVFIAKIERWETIKESIGLGAIAKNDSAYIYQIASG
ncbi:unnamed protein product [marine sediment metagenome]|uniref:Uncharacterized protein n=1 Tax=marine sediment metagenome TaxID=412755 RepID=X1FB46_9ZZZZ